MCEIQGSISSVVPVHLVYVMISLRLDYLLEAAGWPVGHKHPSVSAALALGLLAHPITPRSFLRGFWSSFLHGKDLPHRSLFSNFLSPPGLT